VTEITRTLGAAQAPATDPVLLDVIRQGGIVGYIIIGLSLISLALVVAYALRFRTAAIAPASLREALRNQIANGNVSEVKRICDEPSNSCALTQILGSGLKRLEASPFGALELRSSLEEAGQERIARLVRSTDGLALMASIAPMLGLLGTVIGINGAFATIADSEGFARPDQLAGDISLALITTIMGLSLAIPATAAVTFFRNKIERLGSELANTLEDYASMLETARAAPRRNAEPATQQRPQRPAGPVSRPSAPEPGV
jgi:biopolymer transport protein ExbB